MQVCAMQVCAMQVCAMQVCAMQVCAMYMVYAGMYMVYIIRAGLRNDRLLDSYLLIRPCPWTILMAVTSMLTATQTATQTGAMMRIPTPVELPPLAAGRGSIYRARCTTPWPSGCVQIPLSKCRLWHIQPYCTRTWLTTKTSTADTVLSLLDPEQRPTAIKTAA